MGQRLIHMLLALIQGQEDVEPEVLPAKLVIRESTGLPPFLSDAIARLCPWRKARKNRGKRQETLAKS